MSDRPTRVAHCFVESVPDRLEPHTLYVSVEYATVAHLCLCGCGLEVITPLTPTDWSLAFDGDTVSISPSVGNWSFPCRSHYLIRRNRVRWVTGWSPDKVARGRQRDRDAKASYFGIDQLPMNNVKDHETDEAPQPRSVLRRLLARRG